MVKVTFRPWEEVIIHESIQYTLDEIFSIQTVGIPAGGLAPPLNWAEGVIFRHVSMPPTDDVIREQLEGKIHWSSVAWALMPNYKKFIDITENKVRIPIVDVSANKIFCEVAMQLKKIAKI